ncbi:hypothetical protein BJ875DRAFT_233692 [Amylocarpus encephaloides]|uniref:Uncharacterized protein n=1 Tax=Amylocarpus encephaloides TaxID=45428 RepID=A0A9P7Y8U2_9HELO|nr:hypothetical protein BJ875DRAFT_233692 [Amylocarpus encephaloides]
MSNFVRFVATRLDSARSQKNRSFMSRDSSPLASERPKFMSQLLSLVSRILIVGELVPIKPVIFDISETEAVFKVLQHGNSIEKMVLWQRQEVRSMFVLLRSPVFLFLKCLRSVRQPHRSTVINVPVPMQHIS